MKVGFIGAGRVGCSTGLLLKDVCEITGFYSKSRKSSAEAAQLTGSRAFDDEREVCENSEAVFLTVPDREIKAVWQKVKSLSEGKIVCHMSGALSAAEAFEGAAEAGAAISSIHPMMAVSGKTSQEKLRKAFFTAEGDAAHKAAALFEAAGCSVNVTDSLDKARYHAAAVLASNLVVSLIKMSCEELEKCGFEERGALCALRALASENMENIFSNGFEKSLTGPLERGDSQTVKKHLAALDGDIREAYIILSRHLLETAKRKNAGADYSAVEKELGL